MSQRLRLRRLLGDGRMATWINGEPVCVKKSPVERVSSRIRLVSRHEDNELTHEDMVEAGLAPTEAEWEADYRKQILDCMM